MTLEEDKFIHEGVKQDPFPLALFVAVIALLTAALLAWQTWRTQIVEKQFGQSPFLQVTYRDFAPFLWQNPEFLPQNRKKRSGYLPGWDSSERIGIKKDKADSFVAAPPEVLFRYHHWKRLTGDLWIERPISEAGLQAFASDQPERSEELEPPITLSTKKAFIAWRNFYIEGDAINGQSYTAGEVRDFLVTFPQYLPRHWAHVLAEEGTPYLTGLADLGDSELVASELIPPFLKVALYNSMRSGLGSPLGSE